MTKVFSYTIPAGATLPGDFPILDLGGRSPVALLWPAALTNTSVQFRAALFTGSFPVLSPGGSAFTEVAVPGDLWTLNGAEVRNFRVLQRLVIMTGAGEAVDRVLQVVARHVG